LYASPHFFLVSLVAFIKLFLGDNVVWRVLTTSSTQ
jgi:hypothetical protein